MFNLHEYMLFVSYSAIKGKEGQGEYDRLDEKKALKKRIFFRRKKKVCEKV